jgi:hypothetical protein
VKVQVPGPTVWTAPETGTCTSAVQPGGTVTVSSTRPPLARFHALRTWP